MYLKSLTTVEGVSGVQRLVDVHVTEELLHLQIHSQLFVELTFPDDTDAKA